MVFLVIKTVLSALIVVVVSEVAKRSGAMGGLIASIPLVSVLALVWVYLEQKQTQPIIELSHGVAVFVLPSLVLFIALPMLLQRGMPFWGALALSIGLTMGAYGSMAYLIQRLF